MIIRGGGATIQGNTVIHSRAVQKTFLFYFVLTRLKYHFIAYESNLG